MESENQFNPNIQKIARYMELKLLGINMSHVYSSEEEIEMRTIEQDLALSEEEIIEQGKDIILE